MGLTAHNLGLHAFAWLPVYPEASPRFGTRMDMVWYACAMCTWPGVACGVADGEAEVLGELFEQQVDQRALAHTRRATDHQRAQRLVLGWQRKRGTGGAG